MMEQVYRGVVRMGGIPATGMWEAGVVPVDMVAVLLAARL